jgi:hypothetical protein
MFGACNRKRCLVHPIGKDDPNDSCSMAYISDDIKRVNAYEYSYAVRDSALQHPVVQIYHYLLISYKVIDLHFPTRRVK